MSWWLMNVQCFSAHVRIIFICGPNIALISMRKFYNTPPLMSWCGLELPVKLSSGHIWNIYDWKSYLEMLSQWLVPELDKILQQDGAPVHFWTPVREWLNKIFATWIGCGGPLIWPPRSPDLTCDNGLWSYLKENLSIIQMDSVELKRERYSIPSERSLPICSGGQADGHCNAFNCAWKMIVHILKC